MSTSGGIAKPGSKVALAPAGARGVDGQRDRLEARIDRLVDERPGDPAVAEAVELKPARRPGRLAGNLARARGGEGRQAHDRLGVRRRSGHRHLAVGIDEPLEGDRGDQHRHRDRRPEDRRLGAHVGDVDQHPRTQADAGEGGDVVAQGALVAGPAGEVAVDPGLEALAGEPLVIGDVDRLGHSRATIFGETMSELIHTCYRVLDLDRSAAFYEKLGFEEMRRMPIGDDATNCSWACRATAPGSS